MIRYPGLKVDLSTRSLIEEIPRKTGGDGGGWGEINEALWLVPAFLPAAALHAWMEGSGLSSRIYQYECPNADPREDD